MQRHHRPLQLWNLHVTGSVCAHFGRGAFENEKVGAMGLDHVLDSAVTRFAAMPQLSGKATEYRGMYIGCQRLASEGVRVGDGNARRPLLMLGGTSISIEDQKELIVFLLDAGLEVAAIQTPLGGPLDVGIHPMTVRPHSLKDFIGRLKESERVEGVDIVAHSYAAFEVVRLLTGAPQAYRQLVKSVLLINPPGFERHTGFISHCFRVIWWHIIGGYANCWCCRFGLKRYPYDQTGSGDDDFLEREIAGINAMTFKALKNPARSFREILDIVTFRLIRPIHLLRTLHGFEFYFFLNAGDRMVPVRNTLKGIAGIIPARNIRVVSGGHNDLLFQKWQRPALLEFIEEIRRGPR